MEITGKIIQVGQVQSGVSSAGKAWSKQSFVIEEVVPEWPKSLAFEVWNDKIALNLNEKCSIHFQTKAKEYNGRWFNEVQAYKKEGGKTENQQLTQNGLQSKPQGASLVQTKPEAIQSIEAEDDLPF